MSTEVQGRADTGPDPTGEDTTAHEAVAGEAVADEAAAGGTVADEAAADEADADEAAGGGSVAGEVTADEKAAGASSGEVTGAPQRPRGAAWLAGALLAALLFCAASGWLYWSAHTDDDLAYSRARDQALAAGRTHLTTLNSIDVKHIGAGLREWRDATTGPLRDQLRREADKSADTLEERGTSARARVTDAALTGLDDTAGTAKLIATVRITTTTRGGSPAADRKRMAAGLERTDDGWKLTSLAPVPVGEER
ncbi:hypothetical protein [Streptomyces sp. PU-14G]|uniref:hypothetical protein n=1 Tax=Streptomyces sp. PU-14G TaxID=2800808 RepID=UPI0034E00208